jgi:uncharacterized protein YgbK (DUF1537 family)
MTLLRLIADDLTGALDAAAPFASADRPIPVFSADSLPPVLPPSYAVDLGTRERDRGSAAALAARHAGRVWPAPGVIAFRKLDSLLRGSGGHELAAAWRAHPSVRCVIAPAFPFHGRITRGGRQWVVEGGRRRPTGEDLRASLQAHGIRAPLAQAGDPVPPGVSLWDAATDGDLRRIAQVGRRMSTPILWCGSGGLAGALAGRARPAPPAPGRPLLGLLGTDHPATAAQLSACGEHVEWLDSAVRHGEAAARRLARTGLCLVAFAPPPGRSRAEVAAHIACEISALAAVLPRPQSLIVAGGETLCSVVRAVGAGHLEVWGQIMPGLPISTLRGGFWDGTTVVSKSGAFGGPGLLRQLAGLEAPP